MVRPMIARFISRTGPGDTPDRGLPFYNRVLLLLIGAFLAVVAANIATYYMQRQNAEYSTTVLHSHRTQIAGWQLISLLTDAETGQRGFMLTARPDYLAIYSNALNQLPGVLDEMEVLVKHDAELEPRLERVQGLYQERRQLMQESIDMARQGRIGAAVSLVRSGRGKQLMDSTREEITAMSNLVESRTEKATKSARRAQAMSLALSIVSVLLVAVLGLIGAMLVRRQFLDLVKARNEVAEINAGLEEEVRDRTAELVRANEEVQRFAYIVSHDLRAPLVNVMGYTSELEQISLHVDRQLKTLEELYPDAVDSETVVAIREDAPEAIGFIRASTSKMDRLIKAILQLSRDGRRDLAPQPLDMKAVIQNIIDGMSHSIHEHDGHTEIGNLPHIVHDRMAIEQIFSNLIDNAIKYRKPEQSLLLAINGRELAGDEVEFTISDNGRGIAPKDHERVFELFRRAGRQDRPGEGVGLAFVRSSVRRLGGTITIESEVNEGTIFRIRLPKRQPDRLAKDND